MPQSLAAPATAPPRPRIRRTAAGVVAQYIHELSGRRAEAARGRAVQISTARASRAGALC